MAVQVLATDVSEVPPRVSEWRRFLRVFLGRKTVIIGIVFVLIVMIVAVFAPFIAPYDPTKMDLSNALAQPSSEHFLGTDALGRDVFSRLVYGARASLAVGLLSIPVAAAIGCVLGLIAGYYSGWVNTIIMRLTDTLMTFPTTMLALVIAGILGGGLKNIVIALAFSRIPNFVRLVCAQTLSTKEQDYVTAARVIGSKDGRIIFKHILHNCVAPLIVQITLWMGQAILTEAGLSFLGVGILPPTPAWGSMINDGYQYLLSNPILSFAPGVAVMITVFGFNFVGDGLRDAMDPRLRGKL